MANATDIFIQMSEKKNAAISSASSVTTTTNDNDENSITTTTDNNLNNESIDNKFGRTDSYTDHGLVSSSSRSKYYKPPPTTQKKNPNNSNNNNNIDSSGSSSTAISNNAAATTTTSNTNTLLLVRPNEIPVYLQRSSFQMDDILNCFRDVEPARFNFPKPLLLADDLSDDAWAALQLRVDHVARNILDINRYYAGATCVSVLITIVFYAIRPGYDRRSIHATDGKQYTDDDEIYDDYVQDDLWEANHSLDDVVVAELNYLNSGPNLDRSMWIWRSGLVVSVILLFSSVIFIVILMERRNQKIDEEICKAIEEIRPRFSDEGIGVDYRTRCFHPGAILAMRQYVKPTRVVVFYYLDQKHIVDERGTTRRGDCVVGAAGGGDRRITTKSTKRTRSFFSEDYQRQYFPPIPKKSTVESDNINSQYSSFSIL
jgi:hypothetical protein